MISCFGRPSTRTGDFLGRTVPFAACPPCTSQLKQEYFSFSFVSSLLTFDGFIGVLQNYPGAARFGSYRAVCGFARLKRNASVDAFKLEAAGPGPTLSRTFYEAHPNRSGGFIADNMIDLLSMSFLSKDGLLFRSSDRYFDSSPPDSGDGPAPGPGRAGGKELNIYSSEIGSKALYFLSVFDAEKLVYEEPVSGTFMVSFSTPQANQTLCPLPSIHKHLWDVTYSVDGETKAVGSFGTLSGVPQLPKDASHLIVCGSVELEKSVAFGGPTEYTLVALGPNQAYRFVCFVLFCVVFF